MSNPCFLIYMKKILCLFMAAMMAVVMMGPLEAEAASSLQVSVKGDVPSINGYTSGAFGETGSTNGGSVSYDVIVPLSVVVSGVDPSSYVYGRFALSVTPSFVVNAPVPTSYQILLTDVYSDFELLHFSLSSWDAGELSGTLSSNSSIVGNTSAFFGYLDESFYTGSLNTIDFTVYLKYTVYLRGAANSLGSYPYLSAVSTTCYVIEGTGLYSYDYPPEKGWLMQRLDKFSNDTLSGISGFKLDVGTWFSTQWEKMSEFTDRIVSAITGAGGGDQIGTAQDELDNQLNSIENVEQQLSDKVLDKVEVPSISLSSDETSGLNWVVSTINSLYVAFDELHVMFACVVFFSICAVLLFGRRNL